MSISYPCGCVNEVHGPSGVLRSVSKCRRHRDRQRDPATLGEAYYTELGVLRDGELAPTNHVAELAEALGPFPPPGSVLEVGCGASPYAGGLIAAGWLYAGVDASPWAVGWLNSRFGAGTAVALPVEWCWETQWGERNVGRDWGLVLAAHVLEHLADAPAALSGLAGLLAPGGELWVVVPDDSDPTNPDHLFFFTPDTLHSCLEAAGLVVVREAVRRYVPHERFLYARAVKSEVSSPAPPREAPR